LVPGLVSYGCAYRLHLTAAETKTGRPYLAAVPQDLTTYIHQWLNVYRPFLQLVAARRDRGAQPMGSGAIRAQIESRTRQAFGNAIWPHLFRDCAVTELVDCAPEDIGIAPDLLGHADLQTTRKHYIQAQGIGSACPTPGDDREAQACRGSAGGRCLTRPSG
jgi:integrase/recombinase XerD